MKLWKYGLLNTAIEAVEKRKEKSPAQERKEKILDFVRWGFILIISGILGYIFESEWVAIISILVTAIISYFFLDDPSS